MKRLLASLLALILLFSMAGCGFDPANDPVEPTPVVTDPLTNLTNILKNSGKLIGIAYLGQIDGDLANLGAELAGKEYTRDIPFVKDITNISETEGNHVFCIIPAEESVTVSVHKYEWSDEKEPSVGEVLISTNTPVLVRGNVNAYIPQLYVIAQKGSQKVEYALARYGIEGKLEDFGNQVFDFTPYHILPEFHNVATEEKPLCAGWLGTIRDASDTEISMLLYIHESGTVRFTYGNDNVNVMEMFTGTWEIDGNLLKLRMEGGKPGFGEEVYPKNVDFEWDLYSGAIQLRHIGGDPLLSGTEGDIFEFWNND